MFDWRSAQEWKRLWRYYQAGIVNTLFGYGIFAGFVALGINMYVAQVMSHVLGATFNYFTYSRYAFAGHDASKLRFILSYAVNYLFSLGCLAALSFMTSSPYLAGLVSTVIVSATNYLVLRHLVFRSENPVS
jgi:putative flippase GtrA